MSTQASRQISTTDRDAYAAALKSGAKTLGLVLSDRQIGQLLAYLALLSKWNGVYNLTAIRDPAQMVTHHLLDSLSVVAAFAGAEKVLDVGAGAGLPGIVLAIWAMEAEPGMRISLVDTVQKKTAFLTQVKAELGLSNVTVHNARVEQMKVQHAFDLITSRAFAELADFVTWSAHLLAPQGQFVAMKGTSPAEEIARLPGGWIVSEVRQITVPSLDAERHLVWIERQQDSESP